MPKIRETIESWFCLLVNTPLSMPVLYNEVKEGRNQVVSSCLYRRRSRLSDRSKQTVKGVWALWKLASKTVSAFLNSPELSQWEWGRVRGLAYPNHIFQWLLYIVLQAYINCNSLALHRPFFHVWHFLWSKLSSKRTRTWQDAYGLFNFTKNKEIQS